MAQTSQVPCTRLGHGRWPAVSGARFKWRHQFCGRDGSRPCPLHEHRPVLYLMNLPLHTVFPRPLSHCWLGSLDGTSQTSEPDKPVAASAVCHG